MRSMIHTGASVLLKVAYEDGAEKAIGYARNFTISVTQGQKSTFVVDSVTPAEIAQGATPSFLKGSMTLYLPKGSLPETMGLVPYRQDSAGVNIASLSKYLHFRVYDRSTMNLMFACEYCKVSDYTIGVSSRGAVSVQLNFDGMMLTPGLTV